MKYFTKNLVDVQKIGKICGVAVLCLLMWGLACGVAIAEDLSINAPAYVLMEADSGEILAEHNADAKRYPASTTKIMTLTLALEAVSRGEASLDDVVTTSEYAASMGGSQVYLYAGEQRSLREMLIAVAVGSGNDASVAVAEHIGGSLGNFVEMMNRRAQELGMTGTHYANPHGLHDAEHYTTAGDMAKLAHHAVQVPGMLDFTGIYEYQFRGEPKPLVLWNTNRLLKWYEGADGLKTGYTSEAGRNLVATAKRGDMRLISVVMGVEPKNGHFTESMKLLNWGFNNFSYQLLYADGADVCAVPVEKGTLPLVDAYLDGAAGVLRKAGDNAEYSCEVEVSEWPKAPLLAGDVVGKLVILRDGEPVRELPLLARADVAKMGLWQAWSRVLADTLTL